MDGVTALQKHLVRVKLEHAEREAALERTVAELKGENDELKAALDASTPRILLAPGHYVLTDSSLVCSTHSALCLDQPVSLEAEVAGTVVLNAARSNRVFYITGTGVELVGLNITGGYKSTVSVPTCRTHMRLPAADRSSGPLFLRPAATFHD